MQRPLKNEKRASGLRMSRRPMNGIVSRIRERYRALRSERFFKIIAVTLHAGIWEKYAAPDPDKVKSAEEMGVTFLTCTHSLMGNVGTGIMQKFGGINLTDLIAHTYYTFSQGTKVAVEIVVMAADAGLIPVDEEVISIAGTDGGADTALVIKPAYCTDFFSLRVRELIAKPR